MGKAECHRKLCLKRVISPNLYFTLKLLRKKRNHRVKYIRKMFDLSQYSDDECLIFFRFTKTEINLLLKALEIPNENRLRNRIKFSGQEGFCLLLRRLSSPNRLSDLVAMFHRDEGTLSKIISFIADIVYSNYAQRLCRLEQNCLISNQLQQLANNLYDNGCPYPNVIGFIDGTCRPICRPTYNQRNLFSGYKRLHCVKYQSVLLSNGLIGRLDGPFIGRRHDSAILHLSRILFEMETFFTNSQETHWAIYGDGGYSNQKFIKVGFKNVTNLTAKQRYFNKIMSGFRVGVEYGFGKVLQQFAYLDFKKNQKLYLCPSKKYYFVAAFLVNCQSCIRGTNQIADIFQSHVPTLEEYLS